MKNYRIIKVIFDNNEIAYQIQKRTIWGFWKTYAWEDKGFTQWFLLRDWGNYFVDYTSAKKVYDNITKEEAVPVKIEVV